MVKRCCQLQTERGQLGPQIIPGSKLLKLKQIITSSVCPCDNPARYCCRYQSIRRTITNSDRTEEAPAELLPEPEGELMPHSMLGESTLWLKANVSHWIRGEKKNISSDWPWHFYVFWLRPAEYRRDSAVAHGSGRSRLSLLLQSPCAKFLCSPDFFTVLHSNPVSPLSTLLAVYRLISGLVCLYSTLQTLFKTQYTKQ